MIDREKLLKIKPIHVDVEGPTLVGSQNGVDFNMLKIDWIKTPMVFRQIDQWLIKPIFAVREYAIPLKDFEPKFILDCGGNIGTSAVFFANYYPNAKITAVEPDNGNFQLLSINTSAYPNVKCIQAALWDKETYIELQGWHPSSYKAFETDANNPDAIKTTTIKKLLADSGFDEIDLLKMDIEGSEKEVFEADDVHEWMPKVKVLAMELHDRYKTGCSRALFKVMLNYKFLLTQRGENLIFIREDLLS